MFKTMRMCGLILVVGSFLIAASLLKKGLFFEGNSLCYLMREAGGVYLSAVLILALFMYTPTLFMTFKNPHNRRIYYLSVYVFFLMIFAALTNRFNSTSLEWVHIGLSRTLFLTLIFWPICTLVVNSRARSALRVLCSVILTLSGVSLVLSYRIFGILNILMISEYILLVTFLIWYEVELRSINL